MKISELINALVLIASEHGDLPCGGESRDNWVRLTVCDEHGHDAVADMGEPHCGPSHSVYIEVW